MSHTLKNSLFVLAVFVFFACKQENNQRLMVEMEQKNALVFEQINKAWTLAIPLATPTVQTEFAKWAEWQRFEQEVKQKPRATISAFKLKVQNLAKKSDSLHLSVPPLFNVPQVRSRIVAMQTKIEALDTYFSLDVLPKEKVQTLILAINKEINAFYAQCEEVVIKNNIPLEIGEKEMISALDTTRNAKNVDFDELEKQEVKIKKD